VANQYVHPDGRGYQEFTKYRRVRGRVDLDFADFRDNRRDPPSQDSGLEVNRLAATQAILLPATKRRSRRKGMGETAGIRETPPSLGARLLFSTIREPRGN
jgi:hypothetical protein